ncbi:MAG: hypothetical protein V9H69_26755 [Anaerolineae bacterium]
MQQGVGVVKDNAAVVGAIQGGKGPVHVGGQQHYGDTYVLAPEDRSDPVALRQAYLHRVLEQTQTLQLTGVDPKAAQDATARSGLALAAVYTALMTQQSEQELGRRGQPMPDREMRRLSAVELLNRERQTGSAGRPWQRQEHLRQLRGPLHGRRGVGPPRRQSGPAHHAAASGRARPERRKAPAAGLEAWNTAARAGGAARLRGQRSAARGPAGDRRPPVAFHRCATG